MRCLSGGGVLRLALGLICGLAFAELAASKPMQAAEVAATRGVILKNLPPVDSASYAALHKLSGAQSGQALEMTKSEMWNVPEDRVEALVEAAEKQGVGVTRLDETWNHALAPMSAGSAMTAEQEEIMHHTMDSKAAMGMSMMALPEAHVLEFALTKDMDKTDGGAPPTLVLQLKDGVTVTAKRTRIVKERDRYVWHGEVEETGDPVTLLWWPSGRLTGSVTYRGHMFAVKALGGGVHGVVEMAPDALPPEHAPMDPALRQKLNMTVDPFVTKGDASMMRPDKGGAEQVPGQPMRDEQPRPDRLNTKDLEDAPSGEQTEAAGGERLALALDTPPVARKPPQIVISVIVAYTKAAAGHYADIETDLIALAIEDANQSFRNSGIGHVRLELAHVYQTDYAESGSHFDHVFRFADKGDGYMEEVHALRDQYRADVGLLIVHDPQGCGLAAQVVAPANRAFAVVHHECAATGYSLAHEIGHLIGARHDLALDNGMEPFPYGHGFVLGTKWRTMMSYKESCDGCPRLPIWSNPQLKVRGVAAGDDTADNARVIAEQAARVAAFR